MKNTAHSLNFIPQMGDGNQATITWLYTAPSVTAYIPIQQQLNSCKPNERVTHPREEYPYIQINRCFCVCYWIMCIGFEEALMSTPLTSQTITCKVCCFSTKIITSDNSEYLPACKRCGPQRWDVSATEKIKNLKPIPFIKNLLHTKIF